MISVAIVNVDPPTIHIVTNGDDHFPFILNYANPSSRLLQRKTIYAI